MILTFVFAWNSLHIVPNRVSNSEYGSRQSDCMCHNPMESNKMCVVTLGMCVVTLGMCVITLEMCVVSLEMCVVTLEMCVVTLGMCVVTTHL
jgi:hypothetical protein